MTTKDKWFGVCNMCGAADQKLSTTQTKLGPMLYYIRRCCDHCQTCMRLEIDHTMLVLVADRKQLENDKNRKV